MTIFKMLKKLSASFFMIWALFSFCSLSNVYAQSPTIPPRPPISPQGSCLPGEVDTAIGCVPVNNMNSLVETVLTWSIGVGSGISLILIIYAGFQITTSVGNPEHLKKGQDLLTAAIAGLLLIIFSVFILELVGVRILKIPNF